MGIKQLVGKAPIFLFTLVGMVGFASGAPALANASAPTSVEAVYRRLEELTTEKSPEIRLAVSKLEQKRAARYTAWTALGPRLDLKLSYTVGKDYSALTSGSLGEFAAMFQPVETSLDAYQLVAQMPLFDRSVHLGVSRANAELELAKTEASLAKAKVTWNLRQVFGSYLVQSYKLATVGRSIEVAKSNLQEAQLRFQLGSRTVIDVLKAQAQLAQLESQRASFEADRAQALNRLLDYTGLAADELDQSGMATLTGSETALADAIEKFVDTDALLSEAKGFPSSREELGRRLEAGSTALRRLEQQEEYEKVQARGVGSSDWPQLSLRGSLSRQSPEWGRTFSTDQTSYSYGVVLNIPLFSFGSSWSSRRESSELALSSEIKRKREGEDLLNNVQNLVLKAAALARSIDSLRYTQSKNTEIEKLTLRSYQLGKSSFIDLQGAQNDLLQSKINLAQAQIDLAVAVWQIKWNLGALE